MAEVSTKLEIKRQDGTTIIELADFPEGSILHRELMGEHYIKLPFSLENVVYPMLGDYVQTSYGKFELTDPYSPTFDKATGGYNYELKLDAHYIKWKNKICKYLPLKAASETSFSLTANLGTHLNVILSNLSALGAEDLDYKYNGSDFNVTYENVDTDTQSSCKLVQYQGTDIISALNTIASTFDVEWWVEDNIIHVGKCSIGSEVNLEYNVNVVEMSRSESSSEYATRLYVFGAEKNLPASYRADSSADITKNGVVTKRVMLPLAKCPHGYVQKDSVIRESEAVEAVYTDEDIYPKVECTVNKVDTYESTAEDETTGENVIETFYRVYDGSGFNFSEDLILFGQTLHIVFESGSLNGMDFECQYNSAKKYYEVVANEDYGRKLPDTTLHPKVGDKFILYNWDATKMESTGIIATAEEALYQVALKKLEELSIDPNTYEVTLDSEYASSASYQRYDLGQKVKLINPAYFTNGRSSRVIGFEIKLDIPYDEPQYTIGESAAYSKTGDLQAQIDSIKVNGQTFYSTAGGSGGGGGSSVYVIKDVDATPSSDYNVYSAKRSDRQFLRKDAEDTAQKRITFEEGLISKKAVSVGNFVSGSLGQGALIDADGNMEVESLYSRSFISTPEFRFNRIAVTEGENWCTNGYGTILDVDTTNKIITLKLEENDYASIKLGDICRGIYNDIAGEYSTYDQSEDECGFSTKKGYFTSYFYVSEIIKNTKGECKFKYQLRNASTPHPCKFMKFAQYGSFTDTTRQSSSYSTSIGNYYEEVLEGVNTWKISDSNIVYRHGWLGTMQVNLNSGEVATLEGNGLYVQDNVYFGNAIVQLDPVSLTDIQQKLKQYSVEFSDYVDVITVDDTGNVIGGLFKVDRDEEGNITNKYDYRIHSAIYVKRGNDFLTLAEAGKDAGTGTYKVYTQCDGCECVVNNSTLCITKINNVKDGIAGTEDDTDFDYTKMRNVNQILVTVTIDCEGIGTISRAFPVSIKHDSQPYVRADIDNEFSGASWNTKTQAYVGLPIVFNYKMWRNNEMLSVDSLAITGLDSSHYAVSEETDVSGAKYKKVTINTLPSSLSEVTNLNVTGSATYSGISYERTLVHTINKSTDVNVYSLVPSVSSVHINQFNSKSASAVFCKVICNSTENKTYEVILNDLYIHGLALTYKIISTDGTTSSEVPYSASGVTVDTDQATIRFILKVTKGTDVTEITEDVPVLLDGVDGRGVEYVFYCKDEESAPSLYDDHTITAFQSDDYCPYVDAAHTDRWTDEPSGVGANSKYEYYAQRKKVNGVWQAFGDVKLWDRYPVDGSSPYMIDLSNDQALINCDNDGTVLGSYETSEIMIFEGGTDAFDKFNIEVTATNITCVRSGRILTPSAITGDSATISVKATLKTNSSIYLTATYKVNKAYKGADGVLYSLVPSLTTIKKDGDGNWIDTSMAIQVKKTIGDSSSLLSSAQEISDAGLTIKYLIGSTYTTISNPTSVNTATICGSNAYAIILLYDGDTVIDRERINVVNNGKKGDAGQSVITSRMFKRGTNVTDKPTGGSFASPNGTGTGWTDGIPSGSGPIWMSSRIFTSDGKTPQQSAWKDADLLVDSADTDICFHDAKADGTQPGTSGITQHGTQSKSVDDGWYNEATEDSVWMAIAYKNEGVWGNWSVMKLKGENGEDAVTINVSGENINAKKNSSAQVFYVRIKVNVGTDVKKYGDGEDQFLCGVLGSSSTLDSGLKWTFDTIDSNETFRYKISLPASRVITDDIDFTVTFRGIVYTYTIHFSTVEDGSKGADGDSIVLLNRGLWSANGYAPNNNGYSYYANGNEIFRDEVIHTINGIPYVFIVKNRTDASGTNVPITAEPSLSSSYWEVGSVYQLLFANCLFADNANIGGFIVNSLLMRSQTPAYRVYYKGEYAPISYKFNYQGTWSSGASYSYDYKGYSIYPTVHYNGKYYRFASSSSKNTSTPPSSDTTNWVECTSEYNNASSEGYYPKNSGKTYSYIAGSAYSDGIARRDLVLYNGSYFVVKTLGASVTNNTPMVGSSGFRLASDEEIAAASSSDQTVEISTFMMNGRNGIITMRQPDDTMWTYDESGKHTMGVDGGMRVEISPSSKDISIFDKYNKQVVSINGENKSSVDSLFPSTIPTFSYKTMSKGYSEVSSGGKVYTGSEELTNEFTLTAGTYQFTVGCKVTVYGYTNESNSGIYDSERCVGNYGYPTYSGGKWHYVNKARANLCLCKVNGSSLTIVKSIMTTQENEDGTSKTVDVNTSFGATLETGTYCFALYYTIGVFKEDSKYVYHNYAYVGANNMSVQCTTGEYLGNIFANGLAFGSSSGNFFAALNTSSGMQVKAVSGSYGFRLTTSGLQKTSDGGNTWTSI